MDIQTLTSRLRDFRQQREWEQFHSAKNLAVSLSIEASELLELFQWSDKCRDRAKLAEEIADVGIYLLYLCDCYGIDLLDAIDQKIDMNEIKYPVNKSKGNSKKYDEL